MEGEKRVLMFPMLKKGANVSYAFSYAFACPISKKGANVSYASDTVLMHEIQN